MPRILWKPLVAVLSLWVVLLLLEIFVRVNPRGLLPNVRDSYEHLSQEDLHPIEYDSTLGWVPRPGRYDYVWPGRTLHVLPNRIRSNGGVTPDGPSILAVGDSFTFGDWVSDHETWPAYLELLLSARVYNGGVSSYGLDQTVLRAELLIPKLSPSLIVVSLIQDDIDRTTVSVRSNAAKPFFRHDERGNIYLDPAPLPAWSADRSARANWLFRSSALLRLLGGLTAPRVQEHQQGIDVSCSLMLRLAALQERLSLPILVLAQQEHNLERGRLLPVQTCATAVGLEVIDTYPVLVESRRTSRSRFDSLFDAHMTPKGNALIASVVHDYLVGRKLRSGLQRSLVCTALRSNFLRRLTQIHTQGTTFRGA